MEPFLQQTINSSLSKNSVALWDVLHVMQGFVVWVQHAWGGFQKHNVMH
jgi:hypothetical protein